MDMVSLQSKEELDIYMNPQRQRLLRILEKSAQSRTPKDLSGELGVSPSSVQHHLKKLESIGLVCLDHTATIRGIVARYYVASRATVHIGDREDCSLASERSIVLKKLVTDVVEDAVADVVSHVPNARTGDVLTGVVFLPPERREELAALIRAFLERNAVPRADAEPWAYAVVYHCAQKQQ